MRASFDRITLTLAQRARLGNGAAFAARRNGTAPPTPDLVLYEYEASPYCRRAREALGVLGLTALIKPCPRETLRREGAFSSLARHKPGVVERGGRLLFPYLDDKTAGVALNESRAIVDHLWQSYGTDVQERPAADEYLNGGTLPRPIDFALLAAPSGLRPWPSAGLLAASASRDAELPLILHGSENEPGSRQVREVLCTLQLAYRSVPCELDEGRPLPHLEDPNSGFRTFGARKAVEYLEETYREGPTLGFSAPVPEPNLGDADRTSWLTGLLAMVPRPLHRFL